MNIGFLETNSPSWEKRTSAARGVASGSRALSPTTCVGWAVIPDADSAAALARGIVAAVIVDCSVAVIPTTLNPMLNAPRNPAKDRANTLPHLRRGRSCTADVTSGSVIASR